MRKSLILAAVVAAVSLTFCSCGNKIDSNSTELSSSTVTTVNNAESESEESLSEIITESENDSTDESLYEENSEADDSLEEPDEEEESGKILVAYFSFPEDGSDADAGASRVVTSDGEIQGNVEYFAKLIAEETGAELFRIETVQQYPGEHEPLVDQAAEERDNGVRPELAAHIDDLDAYDTIFIGYPIWWYDMPMVMNTFFEEYDFSGKTIVPFSSHGGSGFSTSIDDITEYEPNADILEGFTVDRNDVPNAADDLRAWVAGLGI